MSGGGRRPALTRRSLVSLRARRCAKLLGPRDSTHKSSGILTLPHPRPYIYSLPSKPSLAPRPNPPLPPPPDMSPPRVSRLRLSIDSDRDQAFDASQMYQHSHSHSSSANRVFIDSEGRPHDPEFISHIFPSNDAARRSTKKARRLSQVRTNASFFFHPTRPRVVVRTTRPIPLSMLTDRRFSITPIQTGLIQDPAYSDDDMDADDDVLLDPFRNYATAAVTPTRRSVQSQYYYSPTASPTMAAKTSLYPATPAAYRAYQARRTSRFAAAPQSSTASSSNTPTNSSPPSWQHTASLLAESPDTMQADDSSYSPASERWSLRKWSKSSPSRPPAMLDDEPDWNDEKAARRVLKKKRADALSELDEDEEHVNTEDPEEYV